MKPLTVFIDSSGPYMLITHFIEPLTSIIDLSKPSLWLSLAAIAFNPTISNLIARNEYRNRTITRFFRGNAYLGCYVLGVHIYALGVIRNTIYRHAILDQPKVTLLREPLATIVPAFLIVGGQFLNVASTWALGLTGIFRGDYFGIIMDRRVDCFPYNVLRDPIYFGSVMCFAGFALWWERPAGLLITVYVYFVYVIALHFEESFTAMIYADHAKMKKSLKQQ